MSSIYKKGRDGYYYYQRYVFNSKTGKKNKRIFHSLGTKDRSEAEKLKEKLDFDYLNQTKKNHLNQDSLLFRFKNIFIIIAISFISVTLLYKNYFISENKSTNLSKVNNLSLKSSEEILANLGRKEKQNLKEIESSLNLKEDMDDKSIKKASSENDIINPSYLIARVEKLSDAFDQVKIHVTVIQDYGEKSLKNICKNVMVEFSDFSNIIICVYSQSGMGKEIAEGTQINASQEDLKTLWLAMFTYNSVEGEFFDYMPGSYLGFF